MSRIYLLLVLGCAPVVFAVEPMEFQSATNHVQLLELYTSEGCSSCPPAETWLSGLKGNPKLWKNFVPVAFHVDYWDYLGWKDPFANETFSQRQRDYARRWHNDSIYTPGFVLDGKEWLRGGIGRNEIPNTSPKAVGVLSAISVDGKRWTLRFAPTKNKSHYEFHAALLGFKLVSNVKAGENRGRKLQHDFVVLAFAESTGSKNDGVFKTTLSLSAKSTASTERLAFVAWVTATNELPPVQALGDWVADAK